MGLSLREYRQERWSSTWVGFTDVTISVVCRPETTGRLLPMLRSLCTYARQGGALEDHKIDAVLRSCEEAAKAQKLLILNPQFVVTATR